jgi:ABC-2 type transport system ATP-binding protein
VDRQTLEVEVSKERSLNDIFLRLSDLGIEVLSMRNKVNRLEEIFMRLVESHGSATEARTAQAVAALVDDAPRRRGSQV